MKNRLLSVLALPALALAACAPTMAEAPVKASRTYPLTCAVALQAVQDTGLQIRPNDFWNTYRTASVTADRVLLEADSRLGSTSRTSSLWTCAQISGTATLTVSTTGLRGDVAEGVHRAFFAALDAR